MQGSKKGKTEKRQKAEQLNKQASKKKPNVQGKRIIMNKPLIITMIFVLIIAGVFIYNAVVFIQNPTDTFRLEQGSIYEEERAVRLHN